MPDRRDFVKQIALGTGGVLTSSLLPALASVKGTNEWLATNPTDNGKALINPNMGLQLYFYSDVLSNYGSKLGPSDTVDEFPGISTLYMRVPWSFVEQAEGKFTWELLDSPAQRWIEKGKKIALRITAAESWLQYATPQWVRKAGAKGYDWGDKKQYWEPDYGDAVFLKKAENFIAAMANRYDGNPNVAYVDIGHFGLWGEGHSIPSSKVEYNLKVKQTHIDLYCKYFKQTLLAVGDDFAGAYTRGKSFPITDYAFSKGVTLRDDSIMVFPPPNSWIHADLAQLFWPKRPVILEHAHLNIALDKKAWSKDLFLQSIEAYHASYMSVHWWPKEFLANNRDIIDKVNVRIGYRIQLQSISFPSQIQVGKPFSVNSSWKNAGVAPCYPGGHFCVTIKDAHGGIVAALVDESYNMKSLPVADPGKAPLHTINSSFTIAPAFVDTQGTSFRIVGPSRCDVYVSVGMQDGTPTLELPYDDGDGHKRYKVGSVTMMGRDS